MIKITDELTQKINQLPELPGIYKMLDSKGNIIYIGKSKCLKKRVKSYFVSTPKWEKVKKMVGFIHDIDFIVTDTHLEARLLECELIKAVKPCFNSQMKHDKGYVYLKVEDYNVFNALSVVHERDGNSFGPFRSRYKLNDLIDMLKNIYPITKIDDHYDFEYHLFPTAMEKDTFEENKNILNELLTDDHQLEILIHDLEMKMQEAASLYKFETASKYRDILYGMNIIKNGINGYKNLITKNILLTIPNQNGDKLIFVSHGHIQMKENYKALTDKELKKFIAKGLKIVPAVSHDMDEKMSIDFRDILYSEIMSLPEGMVRVLA